MLEYVVVVGQAAQCLVVLGDNLASGTKEALAAHYVKWRLARMDINYGVGAVLNVPFTEFLSFG